MQALGMVGAQAKSEDSLGDIRNVGLCVTELQIGTATEVTQFGAARPARAYGETV